MLQLQLLNHTYSSSKQALKNEHQIARILHYLLVMHMQDTTYQSLLRRDSSDAQQNNLQDEDREVYFLLEQLQQQLKGRPSTNLYEEKQQMKLIDQIISYYEGEGRVAFIVKPSSIPWLANDMNEPHDVKSMLRV